MEIQSFVQRVRFTYSVHMFVLRPQIRAATWLPTRWLFAAIFFLILALFASNGNALLSAAILAIAGLACVVWGTGLFFRLTVKDDCLVRRSVFGNRSVSNVECHIEVAQCSTRQGGHYQVELVTREGERIPVLKLVAFGWSAPIRRAETLAAALQLPFHLDPAVEKGRRVEKESWHKLRFLLILPLLAVGFGIWAYYAEANYQGVEIICRPSKRVGIGDREWPVVGHMRIELESGSHTIKIFDDGAGKWEAHTIEVKESETTVFNCPSNLEMNESP